jgi:hypothetical protein
MSAGVRAEVDRDALLCALVLAPMTFARNRFFALFTEPWARRTRSRAAQLRTIVRHLSAYEKTKAEVREMRPCEDGGVVMRYGVPDLSLERTAMLEPLEIAVVRFALSRRPRSASDPNTAVLTLTDDDRRRVETSLFKLGWKLGLDSTNATLNDGESDRPDHDAAHPTGDS